MSKEEQTLIRQAKKNKGLERVDQLEELDGIKKEIFEEVKKQFPYFHIAKLLLYYPFSIKKSLNFL